MQDGSSRLLSRDGCVFVLVGSLAGTDRQDLNPMAVGVGNEDRVTRRHFESVDPRLRQALYDQRCVGGVHVERHMVHLLAAMDVATSSLK